MVGVKSLELQLSSIRDLALVSSADDSVLLVVPLRWWDLATLLWWLLCPQDRRATVMLTLADGANAKFRAVRVVTRHVKVRGFG